MDKLNKFDKIIDLNIIGEKINFKSLIFFAIQGIKYGFNVFGEIRGVGG